MKTLIKPIGRFLILVIVAAVYGIFVAPCMGVDDKSFYTCMIGWAFIIVCLTLSTLPLMSALLKLNEIKE